MNHPAVFCAVAPEGADPETQAIDMAGFFRNPHNVAFVDDRNGVMLFAHLAEQEYEVHFLFPPEARGPKMLASARGMLGAMFTEFKARAIWGAPPRENRAVRFIGRALGFIPAEEETRCYVLERGRWENLSAES